MGAGGAVAAGWGEHGDVVAAEGAGIAALVAVAGAARRVVLVALKCSGKRHYRYTLSDAASCNAYQHYHVLRAARRSALCPPSPLPREDRSPSGKRCCDIWASSVATKSTSICFRANGRSCRLSGRGARGTRSRG